MALTKENKRKRNRYLFTVAFLVLGIALNVVVRRVIAGWPPDGGVIAWAFQVVLTLSLCIMLGITLNQGERQRKIDKAKRHAGR